MMPHLVGHNVGQGEVAGSTKTFAQEGSKRKIDVNLVIGGAIERPRCGAGKTAG